MSSLYFVSLNTKQTYSDLANHNYHGRLTMSRWVLYAWFLLYNTVSLAVYKAPEGRSQSHK